MVAAPLSSSGSILADADAGPLTTGSANPRLGDLSAISATASTGQLRGEEPQFNYPDIHSDPAKTYHDRFGLDEDHDRFLFPWVMNLIFEDRWLLAESDPKTALQNQYRRRMKIDLRDPDPDTANFPNGAHPPQESALHLDLRSSGRAHARRAYGGRIYLTEALRGKMETGHLGSGLTRDSSRRRSLVRGTRRGSFDFDFGTVGGIAMKMAAITALAKGGA